MKQKGKSCNVLHLNCYKTSIASRLEMSTFLTKVLLAFETTYIFSECYSPKVLSLSRKIFAMHTYQHMHYLSEDSCRRKFLNTKHNFRKQVKNQKRWILLKYHKISISLPTEILPFINGETCTFYMCIFTWFFKCRIMEIHI